MSFAVLQKETVAPTFDNPAEDDDEISDESPTLTRQEITKPGEHDVLLGRGGGTNNHTGNIKFRKVVNEHKMRYLACNKVDKPKVARDVVQLWRKMSPPGRFLSRGDDSKKGPGSVSDAENKWYEVGDKKAREKASQCLRERTPDVLPYIKHLRQQQDHITEQGVTMVQHQLQMQQVNSESDFVPALQASPYQARHNNIVNMLDCAQSSMNAHKNRRGSLPVVPTSMPISAPFPPNHPRRISMPSGGNMNTANSMQMQSMMNQQQRQQQVLHEAYTVVERDTMYPGGSRMNMSSHHAMSERELMMQQQYGGYDMLNMNLMPQGQMMGTSQPMPNPTHSNTGRFVSPGTPRQHSMPNLHETRQIPQHFMQSPMQSPQQYGRQQSLPIDDLEPLPYEGEDNNPAAVLPDVPHSAPFPRISPNVPQKLEKPRGEEHRHVTPDRPQDLPLRGHSPQPKPEDDVFQPLPLESMLQLPQTLPKEAKAEKKYSAEDTELTLREYRRTLEEYITNHQIATPNIDVLDDEYSDDEDLGLIGVDASEWIQNALNDSGNDMDPAKSSTSRRRGSHTLSVRSGTSGAMSTVTSCMSLALSDMEESGEGLSKDLGEELGMRGEKMRMARNMSSNHSIMSELTDFGENLEC
jgi:hypothetical protein